MLGSGKCELPENYWPVYTAIALLDGLSAGDSEEQLYSWKKPGTSLGSSKQYLVGSFINHSSSNTTRFMSPIHCSNPRTVQV